MNTLIYWNIVKNISIGLLGVGLIAVLITFVDHFVPQKDDFMLAFFSIVWTFYIIAKIFYEYQRDEILIKKEYYLKNKEKKQHLSFDEVKTIWNAGEKYTMHFLNEIVEGDERFDKNLPNLETFYKQNYNNK